MKPPDAPLGPQRRDPSKSHSAFTTIADEFGMKKRDPAFNAADVWKVARALLENAINHDVEAPGGRSCNNECAYCEARVNWSVSSDLILHDADCPVLVARDLLTGAPPE